MENNRYSDKELAEFKELIINKINHAEEDLRLLQSTFKNDSNNGTDDTAPTFKAFEEGSETMSKEANVQLAIRQEKFIRDLKNALLRIENKTRINPSASASVKNKFKGLRAWHLILDLDTCT